MRAKTSRLLKNESGRRVTSLADRSQDGAALQRDEAGRRTFMTRERQDSRHQKVAAARARRLRRRAWTEKEPDPEQIPVRRESPGARRRCRIEFQELR